MGPGDPGREDQDRQLTAELRTRPTAPALTQPNVFLRHPKPQAGARRRIGKIFQRFDGETKRGCAVRSRRRSMVDRPAWPDYKPPAPRALAPLEEPR